MAAKKSSATRPARRAKTPPQKPSPKAESAGFPIVAIGASAGGLKAFEQFFANMPPESGVGFVLVPHLDPSHASMLPDLLRKYTKMAVLQAEDGMKVQRDRVHVLPPNTEMVIMHGSLLLKKPKEPRGLRLPIDTFFRSLAEDQRDKAIGIILSGNGKDGTLGLKAIKAELGMAMVQDPSSAEYDSMPSSAIETGMVDYILTPEKMPAQLVTYKKHRVSRRVPMVVEGARSASESLQKIFQLLRSGTGHDFSFYKRNTLCRRIERRMSVHQIERLPDYVSYLERTPQEVTTLFKELLIGVTNFFRDSQAFESLNRCLMAEVLANKSKDDAVRVWVPGCSSGEEVYSIAIILRECMDKLKKDFRVQIFGTDIDGDAIDMARAGLYPASIVADVTPERLKRFFVAEEGAFRIKKEIREMVVFAIQDVLKDAPFTKLDLLSCRNLLIYLDVELQKKLLPLFHYTLRPDGILFLGSSESIDGFTDLFSLLDKKWKLFKRRPTAASAEAVVPFPASSPQAERRRDRAGPRAKTPSWTWRKNCSSRPMRLPAFSSMPTERSSTRTAKPESTWNWPKGMPISTSSKWRGRESDMNWHRPFGEQDRRKDLISLDGLEVKTDGGSQRLTLTVKPVRRVEGIGELLMVVFEDVAPKQLKLGKARIAFTPTATHRISQLEQELKYSQEHLQTTIEELETSNEELKSSNEELQSTNEELQSTNEELETSKEELQSLNEELVTVNAELQGKIEDLSRANDDMKNLLDSTKIATIFLDSQLCIRRFTPEATKIINLIQSDVGRPVSHIVSNLEQDTLSRDAQEVLDSLVSKEQAGQN